MSQLGRLRRFGKALESLTRNFSCKLVVLEVRHADCMA